MSVNVVSAAKINLTLDIVGKKSNGYHDVKMIMQSVGLYEYVELTENNSGEISVYCSNPDIPCDKSNIAVRCAKLFFDEIKKECRGLHIFIHKDIPMQAGLAGGSADGAAVLFGLNEMYKNPFSLKELEKLGERIGSDIPFCLRGGTALAQGIGTELTSLEAMPDCWFVLVKPPIGISTAEAYAAVDTRKDKQKCATDVVLCCLDDIKKIGENLKNDFEDALNITELVNLKRELSECDGALGACMTGSGSTVFAIFGNESEAEECAKIFRQKYAEVFVARPVDFGTKLSDVSYHD